MHRAAPNTPFCLFPSPTRNTRVLGLSVVGPIKRHSRNDPAEPIEYRLLCYESLPSASHASDRLPESSSAQIVLVLSAIRSPCFRRIGIACTLALAVRGMLVRRVLYRYWQKPTSIMCIRARRVNQSAYEIHKLGFPAIRITSRQERRG